MTTFLIAATLIGGVLSWFTSEYPDGLEWSIARITGTEGLPAAGDGGHITLALFQEKTSILSGYALPSKDRRSEDTIKTTTRVRIGSSLSGIVGGTITLAVCTMVGMLLRKRATTQGKQTNQRHDQSTLE